MTTEKLRLMAWRAHHDGNDDQVHTALAGLDALGVDSGEFEQTVDSTPRTNHAPIHWPDVMAEIMIYTVLLGIGGYTGYVVVENYRATRDPTGLVLWIGCATAILAIVFLAAYRMRNAWVRDAKRNRKHYATIFKRFGKRFKMSPYQTSLLISEREAGRARK